MATLPTNYQDDILDISQNTNRKYEVVNNPDGTISLIDRTVYSQEGSQYGAQNVNTQNEEINSKTNKFRETTYVPVDAIAYDPTTKRLGLKVNGADTVIPFSGVDSDSGHASSTGETITLGYRPSMVAVLINPNSQYWTVLIHDGTQSYASWAGQRIDLTDTGFYIWGGSYGSYNYIYMAF